ncbi:MAG: class I tRNA ligase family protein [Clostridiaceae bacterium]|jgi:methionyl-tRNA synthetase|nr:class I tRNA ligase family protein [Clostridiaceae bacterium]
MLDKIYKTSHNESRPVFPKRAVITAGMPYGDKELHFGHIGGVFIHADMFARFLRDRIGKENVIFISGTDCYGSPIVAHYMRLVENGEYNGTIEEFVASNHEKQKEVLKAYHINTDLFAASGLGRSRDIHREVSDEFMETLYKNGHLVKMTTSQFYDSEHDVFLNGRQVVGICPIMGCKSEKAYADECSLGHQYQPSELINPISVLSGKRPEMRDVTNWYFKLDKFHSLLKQWVERLKEQTNARTFAIKSIEEFLEPPIIYVKREYIEDLKTLSEILPEYELIDDESKSSVPMAFTTLKDREKASEILSSKSIRYRTGKTLVPFRLTGNIEWGVPALPLEGLENLTIWVWPESLWAPISFTKTLLEMKNKDKDEWKDWWCSKDSQVYQFIGEDNVYFYGPVEMSMFMGTQGTEPSVDVPEGHIRLPELIVNNHILFLNKKASSSSEIKPPMAGELLQHYTAEQLRAHFLGLGLSIRSVSFQPKPLNPNAGSGSDPVLKEGNLLTNVLNRAVRSCFYTTQKYYDGIIPIGEISDDILQQSRETVLSYERLMYNYEFHLVMNLLDIFIRNINKYWVKNIKQAETENNDELRRQVLIDCFHMVRTAAVLVHPIAPEGAEMIRRYLRVDESFWSWDRIFEPIYAFMPEPGNHKLEFLEPRVDFFRKHQSQFEKSDS